MAAITTHKLVKEFAGGVRAVDGLDLTIEDGEFFALLGPSGCGKTTLLRTIAGLEAATEGRLLIGGRDVTDLPPGDRNIAMVFQDYALFPHMTVADNIAYPLRIQKVPRSSRLKTAEETADGLSLHGLTDRRPGQLSGGQQQRVALARAVASNPQVFLFDEPLSNLDARLRLEARTFLKGLQRELGVTTVFVTHDQAEALALADRMAIMRDGQIQQIGSPREVFAEPANTFVAGFVGSTPMNLEAAKVSGGRVSVAGGSAPVPPSAEGAVADGDEVIWGARPEYLRWSTTPPNDDWGRVGAGASGGKAGGGPAGSSAGTDAASDIGATGASGGGIEGRVTIVENLGASVLITVTADDETSFQVVVDEDDEPEFGARGWVVPRPDRTLLFDARTGHRLPNAAIPR